MNDHDIPVWREVVADLGYPPIREEPPTMPLELASVA